MSNIPLQRSEVKREQEPSSEMPGPLTTSALFAVRMAGWDTGCVSPGAYDFPQSPIPRLARMKQALTVCQSPEQPQFPHCSHGVIIPTSIFGRRTKGARADGEEVLSN